jgi:hypothetical protein
MHVRLTASIAVLYLSLSNPVHAFTMYDTLADWLYAGQDERARITSVLVLTAGQGRNELDDNFFARCIDQVANDLGAPDRRIGDVAAGCTYMAQPVLSDAE